jgi:hypothetical protein
MRFQLSRPWSEQEDQKLMQMLASGASKFRLAGTLKRSTAAVVRRVKFLKGKSERALDLKPHL